MRRLLLASLVVAGTGLLGSARAGDDDPTGTWQWTTPKGVGTLKLKLEGDKVTGKMIRKAGDLKVEDGIFRGGAISFRVPGGTPGGQPMVVSSLLAFVNNVEFADGKFWIPSRIDISQATKDPLLRRALGSSPEQQRLSDIYRRKGMSGLQEELKRVN